MSPKTTAKTILFFSLFLVLSACGELSTTLFSPGGTYQVKALVNGNALESCSLIRQDDKIIPYFAVSVANDPDLMGLLVYLQNSKGDIIGERVLYTIHPVDDAVQQETQQDNDSGKDKVEDISSGDSDSDNAADKDNDSAASGAIEAGSPAQEKQVPVNTKSPAKKYDTVILIKSFEQDMPCFPLPKNMETGRYSLIFEAVGRSSTLSLTESDIFYLGSVEFRLKDISMYLPGLSDTRLIPPGTTVMLEASLDFDDSLNPYVIWYNGRNVISEGSISEGAGNILWKVPEQSGFYSLRLEVLPYRLKRSFTGIFREITLPVSAKASQTAYFFGDGPEYPAKRPLGTVYAEQVKQAEELAANANKTANTSIPPEYSELLRWYRFDGNLDEARLIPDRVFERANEKVSRWAAVGQSYGLSAGPDDTYTLRPIQFFRQGQNQGGGIFLFHIRPVAEGTIFSAFFPTLAEASALALASDGVWMDMTTQENAITLCLKTKATSVEMQINSGNSEGQGLIPIAIEFYIRPYRFEAKLSLGEALSVQSMAKEIRLPGALAGEGRIKLGVDKTAPISADSVTKDISTKTVQPESRNNISTATTAAATTTIWDEFAILYSATPLLLKDNLIEESSETEREKPAPMPATVERPKPNSAAPAAVTSATLENEAPSTDENIFMEQAPAETEDEEAPSLIFLP